VAADDARLRTALVLAGGGSFGAIQVGMLHSLATHGIAADMVVGSSVGSLNGAYYAGNPTLEGIERLEAIWRALRRSDVFPVNLAAMLGFLVRRNFLVEPHGLRMLIESNLTYRNLEDAKIPIHIVATNILTGGTVVLSEGSAAQAIIASAAIPPYFRLSGSRMPISSTAQSPATRRSRWRSTREPGVSSYCPRATPARSRSRRQARWQACCMRSRY
jgi:NTE family protein